VFGLKPTWGVVAPKGQALPDSHAYADISVVGPLARGADDLELALDAMSGADEIDGVAWKLDLPACDAASLRDLRIAVKLRDPNCEVDAQYLDKLQALVDARPSALAVLRFRTISYFTGNCTGRSPGLSPRRMRST
jgi:amidase